MAQKGLWAEGLPIAALLALIALAALGLSAGAERQLVVDEFSGYDGSRPDPAMWVVESGGTGTIVEIGTGALHTTVSDAGHASVASRPFASNNLTLLTFCQWKTGSGEACRVSVETFEGDTYYAPLMVACINGNWRLQYYRYESLQNVWISTEMSKVDTWYSVRVEVNSSEVSIRVREGPAGTVVASHSGFRIDRLLSRNRVVMGVAGSTASTLGSIWDNVTVVDPTGSPNTPPRWLPVPLLAAKANLTTRVDLGEYIIDDQPGWGLLIRSASPHLVASAGTVVDVLFEEVGSRVSVELEVNDRFSSAWTNATFSVLFYNHPPEEDLPDSLNVTEGVPFVLDMSLYIQDLNDPLEDLRITVNLLYAVVDGLDLIITAPEGSKGFDLRLTITDGENTIGAIISIHVTAVDSPPTLTDLPDLEVYEDKSRALDLTSYLYDADTPITYLTVGASTPNCTVAARTLRFLYPRGGFNETVTVWVSDGTSNVSAQMVVLVVEVDDPPILTEVPDLVLTEDALEEVNLHDYVTDEDTPVEELNLTCTDPCAVDVSGLTISFRFTKPLSFKTVSYSVSDGTSTRRGTLHIEVMNVNDPPVITSIEGFSPPLGLILYAQTMNTFHVVVHDEDGGLEPIMAKLSLIDAPSGVTVSGQELEVNVPRSLVGVHRFTLVAADSLDSEGYANITLTILDPYKLPISITLRMPYNFSTVVEGDSVTFSVEAYHPLLDPTMTTTATWTSDIQGDLGTARTDAGVLAIVVSDLEPGLHIITVTVTQGDLRGSMWFHLNVEEAEPVDMGVTNYTWLYLCITMVIIIVIVMAVFITHQAQMARSKAKLASVPPKPPPPTPTSRAGRTAPPATSTYYVAPGRPTIEVVTPMPASREEVAAMPRLPSAAPAPVVTEEEMAEELAPPPVEVVPVPEPEPMAEWVPPEPPVEEPPTEVRPLEPETPPIMPTPSPPPPPTPTPPIAPVKSAREAPPPDVARLVEAVRARPGGVPHYLALFDEQSLARRILTGKKGIDPDGRPIVQIMGDWYYSDPDDPELFLSQWRE